jgi:hypothetical protein
MAFNPRNLVLSGAISNDMAVACTAALTLLLATYVVTSDKAPRLGFSFLLGLGAGVTLLMKYSGGAIIFAAAAAIAFRAIRSRYSLSWLAINGVLLVAGALSVTGAYLLHNWQLYGDILAWNKVNQLNPGFSAPRMLENTLEWLPYILKTFFAHPGYVFTWPNRYNEVMLGIFLLGLAGALWLLLRRRLGIGFWPLLVAIAMNTVTYYSWLTARDSTQNMRFFSPTFIPITLLVALGLLVFVPRRWHIGFIAIVTVTYGAFTSITLYDSMSEMYAFPRYLSEAEAQDIVGRPATGRVMFENGLELMDVQLKQQRISAGSPVELSIVWRTTRPLTTSAHLMLDIRDPQDKTIAALNTGNVVRYSYVPLAWQVGRPVREDYQIIPAAHKGEVLRILAGWSRDGDGSLIHPADNASVSVEIGRVKVRSAEMPASVTTTYLASLEYLADLISAKIEDDALILTWRATAEPPKNYSIFVHGLDEHKKIVGQRDVPFEYSAAYWDKGEEFEQRIELPGLGQLHFIRVGVYDTDTGQRFRALKPYGAEWQDDSIVLR